MFAVVISHDIISYKIRNQEQINVTVFTLLLELFLVSYSHLGMSLLHFPSESRLNHTALTLLTCEL